MDSVQDYRSGMSALLAQRAKLKPLANMHLLPGEKRACALFDYFIGIGEDRITEIIGGDEVVSVRSEYPVPGGRVDRGITHRSGRLTLVEIKDCTNAREISGGIGQVLVYAAKAEKSTGHYPVVPVLAVLGDADEDIARACELGGVEYYPLGDLRFMQMLSEIASLFCSDW